jgi:hypothetical protein
MGIPTIPERKPKMFDRFRKALYRCFGLGADVGLDLIDAVTGSQEIESPVAVSESPLFRRKFSSIYDFLKRGKLDLKQLGKVLDQYQPEDAERIAGFEVYALDCTDDPGPDAETLSDRSQSKKGKSAPVVVGHRYSWLVRLVQWRTSWCMPQDVQRVKTSSSDSQVAAEQVKALAERSQRLKVVVADSLYCNATFLVAFLLVQSVYALVRMKSNQVLFEEPPERQPGRRGRPRKHGAKFRLSDPSRDPDRVEKQTLLGQSVLLQAWQGLHLHKLPFLVGTVVSVRFLKPDGTPRFKRPLLLFWTGPTNVALVDLAQMYLWRFAIEHMFRFLKQQLGLTKANSPDLEHRQMWVWCCALAYTQLVLIRQHVADQRPAWHPRHTPARERPLTPGQVRRLALPFLLRLGTPASPVRRAGKGRGRATGYQPKPRKRFSIVVKDKKQRKPA